MAKRGPPTCDVPGCGASRRRFQRLCAACYRRLPGELRVGITEAHHQHRRTDWNALRARAAAFLNLAAGDAPRTPITPERAYQLQARLLGERPDA